MPLNEMLEFSKTAYGTEVNTQPGITSCFLPGQYGVVSFPLSLETNFCPTAVKIYFPFKCTIVRIRSIVTLALAADDCVLTGANSVGNTTLTVTIAGAAALDEEDSCVPADNNTVAADSYYSITSAKTTKGGELLVSLEYLRTA